MAMVDFSWRRGRSFAVDANVVAARVNEIEADRGGACRPQDLVEDARPQSSPTHPLFDWVDTVAAEKWRIHQARQVLGAITIVRVDSQEVKGEVRAFVNLKTEDEQSYQSILRVMGDDEKRLILLRQALGDAQRFRSRYESLRTFSAEFEEAFSAIDRFVGVLSTNLSGKQEAAMGSGEAWPG